MIHNLRGATVIYIREDGKLVHRNIVGPFVGREYEHDNLDWQPPADWPYEIRDGRKDSKN